MKVDPMVILYFIYRSRRRWRLTASNLMAIHYIHPQSLTNRTWTWRELQSRDLLDFQGAIFRWTMLKVRGVYKWLAFSVGWFLSKSLPWKNGWVHITISSIHFKLVGLGVPGDSLKHCSTFTAVQVSSQRWRCGMFRKTTKPQSLIWTSFFGNW